TLGTTPRVVSVGRELGEDGAHRVIGVPPTVAGQPGRDPVTARYRAVQHHPQLVVAPQFAVGHGNAEGVAGHDDLGQRAPGHGPTGARDLAVDDLGGGRQVEQVRERPRAAADYHLAAG